MIAAEPPPLTRHDLEAKIVKRCWEDEGFRKEFTADPAATFVKYLHSPASSLPRISVHEEELGSWHIVLPAKPANSSELSEEDLEKIAGGTSFVAPISVVTTAVVTSAAVSDGSAVSGVISAVKGW
jgi:hypothetical protein